MRLEVDLIYDDVTVLHIRHYFPMNSEKVENIYFGSVENNWKWIWYTRKLKLSNEKEVKKYDNCIALSKELLDN